MVSVIFRPPCGLSNHPAKRYPSLVISGREPYAFPYSAVLAGISVSVPSAWKEIVTSFPSQWAYKGMAEVMLTRSDDSTFSPPSYAVYQPLNWKPAFVGVGSSP